MGYHIRKPSNLIDMPFYMHTRDEFPFCGKSKSFLTDLVAITESTKLFCSS